MRGFACSIFLTGCSSQPNGYRVTTVTAIGTPVYVALKIPACVVTLAIAAPLSALQGLTVPGKEPGEEDGSPRLRKRAYHDG
jgi:hypothetical protein